MNQLKKFSRRVNLHLFLVLFLTGLAVTVAWWFGYEKMHYSPLVVGAELISTALIISIIVSYLSTRYLIKPFALIRQAIEHISPEGGQVASPNIASNQLGHELVTTLISQVYALATNAENISSRIKQNAADFHSNSVASNLPLPMLIVDAQQNITFASIMTMKVFGISEADIVGKNIYSVLDMSFETDQTFDKWLQSARANTVNDAHSWERVRVNLRKTMSSLILTDLSGIAEKNQARLNAQGIYTPLQFLDANSEVLKRFVFHSVCGEDWYQRLRGYEIDDHTFSTKTIGRQYVLDNTHLSDEEIISRMAYLCETTGMKLRYKNLCARGIMVYARYVTGDYWYERKMFKTTFFSNAEVYRRATLLFNRRPRDAHIREIGVSCYMLAPSNQNQISLLDEVNKEVWLTQAIDRVNEEFGNFTITYATSYPSRPMVKQKIPFGTTRYFELLCRAE